MTSDQAQWDAEIPPSGERITLTFICNVPRVSVETLMSVLSGAQGIFRELAATLGDPQVSGWAVCDGLFAYSEETSRRRISFEFEPLPQAVEPEQPPPPQGLYELLTDFLEAARRGKATPAAYPLKALEHLRALAEPLSEEVDEMWFSQPGITPVFVTHDTLEYLRAAPSPPDTTANDA